MNPKMSGLIGLACVVSTALQAGVAPAAPSATQARVSLDRGLAFLLAAQNPDGSWGSPDPVQCQFSILGWGHDNPGSHHGVINSVTAISAKALLLAPDRTPAQTEAVRKGTRYLLDRWKVGYTQSYQPDAWSYAYTLDFLVALDRNPLGAPFAKEIREVIPRLFQGLISTRMNDGGWAYYTGPAGMGASDGASFTTGTVLVALARAKGAGFAVPPGLLEDAARFLEYMRYPDGSYAYTAQHRVSLKSLVQNLGGSARTQAANVALFEAGRNLTAADLEAGLDYFLVTLPYLEAGRKRITPHKDAPHNISGYFFFYGYHYAAEAATHLGQADQERFWKAIVGDILRTQEKNGCWWDTMCYDYGDKWGTAFALLALERFLETQK